MSSTKAPSKHPASSTTSVVADFSVSANFQGWYLQATPEPIVCQPPLVFYSSSGLADCSNPTRSVPIATGCSGSTLLYNGNKNVCDKNYECRSYKIFPTEGSKEDEAKVRWACLANWNADSIYRTLPARFAASTAAPARTDIPSNTVLLTEIRQPTATNTASATAASTSSKGISGGAIGGIVVGCVAAIAILALFVFRKKLLACLGRNKNPEEEGPAWSPVYMPPQTQSMAQSDSTWQASEMSADQGAIHEIGSSQCIATPRPKVVHEIG